jgi:sugar lactone lactonase YvrE
MANDSGQDFDYLDFEVQIETGEAGAYTVEVIRSPAGESRATMQLPFSEPALTEQLQALEQALLESSDEAAIRTFGQALFDALFIGDVQDRYVISLPQAAQARKGLRIKLRIEVPELARLPWELLYDARADEFVSLSKRTPVIRYLELPQPVTPLAVELPLRMLAMVASPKDLPPLNVEHERERLEQALASMRAGGKLSLEWIDGQTYQDLQRALRPDTYHVFHFIGHGGFDSQTGEGMIALCDEDGNADRIRATDLSRLLADQYALRLVVLNACQGARANASNMFSSTATRLVKRGVPAVVAFQYAISDDAAIAFASAFYEAVADQLPIDAAMSYARTAMCRTGPQWGTPVLYTHAPNGILFQRQASVNAMAPAPSAPEPAPTPSAPEPAPAPVAPPVPAPAAARRPQITPANAMLLQSVKTLEGHTKRVNSVAIAPDSLLIASGSGGDFTSEEQSVRLWQITDGAQLNSPIKHPGSVAAVAFAPDGKILATASSDNAVRLWHMPEARALPVVMTHPESVLGLAFSPDGQTLATACYDDSVRIWRVAGGVMLSEFKGHTYDVYQVAFAPDGQTVASVSGDYSVRLWRVADGSQRTFSGHTDHVVDVAFAPDGQTLATASRDSTVRLWRVADGTLLYTLKSNGSWINGVAFSPDGQIVAAACGHMWSGDYTVRLWQAADGSPLCTLEGHTKMVTCLAFSPDGTLIASGSEDTTIRVWTCA